MSDDILNTFDFTRVKSLFVFSGAGSGKTYTLVKILKYLKSKLRNDYNTLNKKIAVITYTNAAVNEIRNRIEYDSLFHVSTIHSFIWDCIKYYQKDIKTNYLRYFDAKIAELEDKIGSMKRPQAKLVELEQLREKRSEIADILSFSYNPEGANKGKGALSHSVMLEIGARMISSSKYLQNIIVGKYPYLFIDESQDTNKNIVSALMVLQNNFKDKFVLIFIGDQKQRIYSDGQPDLASNITNDWNTYSLNFNYRSASRIVELSNQIARKLEANSEQAPVNNKERGYVRLFICQKCEEISVQEEIEGRVAKIMSEITQDDWQLDNVKILTLEHNMVARRLGFYNFFSILSKLEAYSMSFLRGEVSTMTIFKSLIVPLYEKKNNEYAILDIIKQQTNFLNHPISLKEQRLHYREFLSNLYDALEGNESICKVLHIVESFKVYELPSVLRDAISDTIDENHATEELLAWRSVIQEPISSVINYYNYVNDKTRYGTHQGVKGLEFDRVLGIMDDGNAGGHFFSYDKVFGAKELSQTDIKNSEEGKETAITRTLRLLYVICTRAKKSLALLLYTLSPDKAKQTAIENGWFAENEIEILDFNK